MSNHEAKNCPRCQALFTCKSGNILRCQCNEIKLSTEESAFIEDRYNDCLCSNCLQELKQRFLFFKEKYFFNAGR